MITYSLVRTTTNSPEELELGKGKGLLIHQIILTLFWFIVLFLSFQDEAKLGLLNFYSKHVPAGLVLLPLSTKIFLLLPLLMGIYSLVTLSIHTQWRFDKRKQSIEKMKYLFFVLPIYKKEWAFEDIAGLRVNRKNRNDSYQLSLIRRSGKTVLINKSWKRKKLKKLAKNITLLAGYRVMGQ